MKFLTIWVKIAAVFGVVAVALGSCATLVALPMWLIGGPLGKGLGMVGAILWLVSVIAGSLYADEGK